MLSRDRVAQAINNREQAETLCALRMRAAVFKLRIEGLDWLVVT